MTTWTTPTARIVLDATIADYPDERGGNYKVQILYKPPVDREASKL